MIIGQYFKKTYFLRYITGNSVYLNGTTHAKRLQDIKKRTYCVFSRIIKKFPSQAIGTIYLTTNIPVRISNSRRTSALEK